MFFSRRTGILFEFEVIRKPFDLGLEIVYDDFIFSVNFGLVVLFTATNARVQLFYHGVSFTIQVVNTALFDWNPCLISFGYAVYHSFKVVLLFLLSRFFRNYLSFRHQ